MYKLMAALAAGFFIFILWIISLADHGESSIFFDFVRAIPYGDKLGHLGLFGVLTLLIVVGSRFRRVNTGRVVVYQGAVLVALFVIGEEISQAFIPSRTFDLVDLAADSAGIAAAMVVARLIESSWVKRSVRDAD